MWEDGSTPKCLPAFARNRFSVSVSLLRLPAVLTRSSYAITAILPRNIDEVCILCNASTFVCSSSIFFIEVSFSYCMFTSWFSRFLILFSICSWIISTLCGVLIASIAHLGVEASNFSVKLTDVVRFQSLAICSSARSAASSSVCSLKVFASGIVFLCMLLYTVNVYNTDKSVKLISFFIKHSHFTGFYVNLLIRKFSSRELVWYEFYFKVHVLRIQQRILQQLRQGVPALLSP